MNNFTKACCMLNEEWVNSFPDEIEQFRHSRAYTKSINRLFNKMRNDKYHPLTKGTLRALIIAAIIISLAATAMALPQSRKYIIEKFTDHSTYTITDYRKAMPVTDLTVGYLPEGYELVDEFESSYNYRRTYAHNNIELSINKYNSDRNLNFNTESNDSHIVTYNNVDYTVCKSAQDNTVIVWCNNEYIYYLDGNISEDEALKIALSVK